MVTMMVALKNFSKYLLQVERSSLCGFKGRRSKCLKSFPQMYLRGGVKIEKQENLGQCPNMGGRG